MIFLSKTIELKFDKTMTSLAGFEYGKSVYKAQVNTREFDTLIFPDEIKMVASSFVQGFFSELIKKIGIVEINKKITIIAKDRELVERIKKNIY